MALEDQFFDDEKAEETAALEKAAPEEIEGLVGKHHENLVAIHDFRKFRRMIRALDYTTTNPDPQRKRLLQIIKGEIDS